MYYYMKDIFTCCLFFFCSDVSVLKDTLPGNVIYITAFI